MFARDFVGLVTGPCDYQMDAEEDTSLSGMIFKAVQSHDIGLLRTLVGIHHVNMNIVDAQGTTPLIMAAKLGFNDVMNDLLRSGADVTPHTLLPLIFLRKKLTMCP